jgi:PAS domain S-box-containing protein
MKTTAAKTESPTSDAASVADAVTPRALADAQSKIDFSLEKHLLLERDLSESIINSLPGVFYLCDQVGKLMLWNRKLEQVTGYSTEEMSRLQLTDLFTGADKQSVAAAIQEAFNTGKTELESDLVARDGTRTPYFFTGSLMSFRDRPGIIGTGVDIAARNRAERRDAAISKLAKSLGSATTAEQAALIIGDIADELFGWDACAVNLYPGGVVYPILNMDLIDGKRVSTPHKDIHSRPSPRAQHIMQHGAKLFLVDNPAGHAPDTNAFGDTSRPSASSMMAPILHRSTAIGILTFQSYTPRAYDEQDLAALQTLADYCSGALERIRVEQELKSSELRFQSVWENAVEGMRLTDADGKIVAVNKAFCELVGMTAKELVGQRFTVIYSQAENIDNFTREYLEGFRAGTFRKLIDRRSILRDGRRVHLQVTNSYVELSGNQQLLLGLFRDVTEQTRAAEELRKSEAQLRLVWENSLDGMRLLDEAGHFKMVNDAFCKLVEMPREDLLGRPLAIIYEPARGEEVMRAHREYFHSRQLPPQEEKEIVLWNGRKLEVEVSHSLLEVERQPTLLLTTVRDVTVSRRVQRQIQLLEQQQALEKERDRIARDMHDDVGGSLTRITLLSEIAEAEISSGKFAASEDAKSRIQKISNMSRELVQNIDEIVWAVDPGNDTLEKFASYICHMADEVLKVTNMNCRLDVPAILPHQFLRSDLRHNLFLVVKEALNNAIKHSQAAEVHLQMGVEPSGFTISITDNGRGFAVDAAAPFSNGLKNMRKRMEKIGGSFQLDSQPGRGTGIFLAIKLQP